jgi:hypothetical protein
MKSNGDLLARLEARIETYRKKYQENLKGMMTEMKAKMDGNQGRNEIHSLCHAVRLEGDHPTWNESRNATHAVRVG